jgi:hypothetical protein
MPIALHSLPDFTAPPPPYPPSSARPTCCRSRRAPRPKTGPASPVQPRPWQVGKRPSSTTTPSDCSNHRSLAATGLQPEGPDRREYAPFYTVAALQHSLQQAACTCCTTRRAATGRMGRGSCGRVACALGSGKVVAHTGAKEFIDPQVRA